jgi:uncharacterized membrane protein YkoI
MKTAGNLVAALAALGFAGAGIAPGFAGTHERGELKAWENASTSLDAAASAAQKQAGGVVVSIVFAEENGKPMYNVETMNNGTLTETKVDATNGTVIPGRTKQPSELTPEERAGMAAAQQPMSLQQATMAAEQQTQGKAIQSELAAGPGAVAYQIDVVAPDGQIAEVVVDPVTGAIVVK